MLTAGWLLMPTLLRASLNRPRLRYALAAPATLVGVGLLWFAASGFPSDTQVGWWTITASIWFGATLGTWLWYRWLPVPSSLRDPFGPGRLMLVALHIGGAVTGIVLVI